MSAAVKRLISILPSFGLLLVLGGPPALGETGTDINTTAATTGGTNASAAPPALAPILKRVSPGVVNISVEGKIEVKQNPLLQDPFFRQFFNNGQAQPKYQKIQAVGSGVIFDAEHGYVLTNNHVIAHADRIVVTLSDRRQLHAKLVATDKQTDIAVLKVDSKNLTAVTLGKSAGLHVGDYVVAIGDPFGLGQTATFGIVSALGRTGLGIEGYEDFIQTDASINPGNSGGALVDMNGQLIGINTAILSGGGGNVGIGFAIPIDMARQVAQQLIANGKVNRGELGVMIQDLTPALADAMGIKARGGAIVARVMPQSAAEKAGLKPGDVITALNGKALDGSAELRNRIGLMGPGKTVTLTVEHNGSSKTVQAELQPQSQKTAKKAAPQKAPGNSPLAGVELGSIPADNALHGHVNGVFVESVQPGSEADNAGLQVGDIIMSVDQKQVTTPTEIAQVLKQNKDKPILLYIRREDASLFMTIG
jgi:Do/DeqQ family serine protease